MVRLLPEFQARLALGLMFALLCIAAWSDVKRFRIPNSVVFSGAVLGLVLNAALMDGAGFVSDIPGALGAWKALAGLGIGLSVFLPLYMLRTIGAGDVKLMAMVGAFVGPQAVIGTIFLTLMIGGVLSLLVAACYGKLDALMTNVRAMLSGGLLKLGAHELPTIDAAPMSAGRMPYALAIAAGAAAYVCLSFSGKANFLQFI
jgi:prepilin peptidase CpaA